MSDVGQTFQDEPTLWVPIRLNFILFVPKPGRRVRAIVSKLGKKHIGIDLTRTNELFSLTTEHFSLFDT